MDTQDLTSIYLGINNLYVTVDAAHNFIITDHVARCLKLPAYIYWEFIQHLEYIHEQIIKVLNKQQVFCKISLGMNFIINVKSPFANVTVERMYTTGISGVKFYDSFRLCCDEWYALYNTMSELKLPELEYLKPCYMKQDLQRFNCSSCYPE